MHCIGREATSEGRIGQFLLNKSSSDLIEYFEQTFSFRIHLLRAYNSFFQKREQVLVLQFMHLSLNSIDAQRIRGKHRQNSMKTSEDTLFQRLKSI